VLRRPLLREQLLRQRPDLLWKPVLPSGASLLRGRHLLPRGHLLRQQMLPYWTTLLHRFRILL